MTNYNTPSLRLNRRGTIGIQSVHIFLCKLETCCNFFSSVAIQDRMYCGSHFRGYSRYKMLPECEILRTRVIGLYL